MGKRLILFTNSYPYLPGETFLHEELPFVAGKFEEVIIYPLYIPYNFPDRSPRPLPGNVVVKEPLLHFDHKDKKRLLLKGLFNFTPLFFSFKELFSRRVLCNKKNLWIFFNYLLILRAALGNKKVISEIVYDLCGVQEGNLLEKEKDLSGKEENLLGRAGSVAYFYWGDKSALMIPFLKKRLMAEGKTDKEKDYELPQFVVRFHGSDLYEHAKGYLPFREMLYKSTDYAVTISQSGADYIKHNYAGFLPKNISVYRLGSCNPYADVRNDKELPILRDSLERVENNGRVFRIVSCSNVIELKRVHLIVNALKEFGKEMDSVLEMAEQGLEEVRWTHIGDGPLLEEIKRECKQLPSFIKIEFKGAMPHDDVLEYYNNTGADLFVQVSRSEGVPVSIMEALSFGIPVVATDVGGVKEVVNSGCGTLLPADLTATQLKDTFVKYMQMPENDRKKMRSSAMAFWQSNWNADVNYTEFAEFLAQLQ